MIKETILQEVINFLSDQDIVSKTYADHNYLHVYFRSNYKERWLINSKKIDQRAIRFPWHRHLIREIEIQPQYDRTQLGFGNYFLLSYQNYLGGGFLDRRMVVHRLVDRIMDEGWVPIKHPKIVLDRAARHKRIRRLKFEGKKGYQYRAPRNNKVKCLTEHFFDWFESAPPGKITVKEAWTDPILVSKAINRLLKRKKDVTRHSICDFLNSHRGIGHRRVDPSFWNSILGLTGNIKGKSILDLSPDWGWKILAWRFVGCDYHIVPDVNLEGLLKFIDYPIKYDEKNLYDFVFLSGTYPTGAQELIRRVKRYKKRAKTLVAIVNRNDLDKIISQVKPSQIVNLMAYHIRFNNVPTPDRFLSILVFQEERQIEYDIWSR